MEQPSSSATTPIRSTRSPGALSSSSVAQPGVAGSRLNYGLHETVTRIPRSESVEEARKNHFTPDILGLRGSPWDSSVARNAQGLGKHHRVFSDRCLSNTLQPGHIDHKDLRRTSGTTFSKSCQPCNFTRDTAEWGVSSSSW
jgi:hypothetical protein